MDPLVLVSGLLVGVLIVLVLVIRYYHDRVSRLQEELQDSALARRRAAETQNRWTSQWAPVLAAHPFDPRRFRFVGGPVDGVQFEDDRVLFVAFTGDGRKPADARTRDLVRGGRVEWIEVPLAAPPPPAQSAPEPAHAHDVVESWAPTDAPPAESHAPVDAPPTESHAPAAPPPARPSTQWPPPP